MKNKKFQENVISVILPTYNHAKFIGKAIESVLNQTYTNFELIIVDNYSEDNTEEIITSYKDNRIKYLKFRNNGIIAASRNYGINNSIGEYVAFLDSDDVWFKNKIEKQLYHIQTSEIIGVSSNAKLIADTFYYRKKNFARSEKGYLDYCYKDILKWNPIITSSLVLKKEIFKKSGLFNESKDFCFIEDWELWLRIARHGLIRVLEEPLLFYRVSRKRGNNEALISKKCLKIINNQLKSGYAEYKDLIEPSSSIYLAIARNLIEFNPKESREYYKKALRSTSSIRKKIKSCLGFFLSFFPLFLKRIVFLFFYKIDRIIFNLKEFFWNFFKNFGK